MSFSSIVRIPLEPIVSGVGIAIQTGGILSSIIKETVQESLLPDSSSTIMIVDASAFMSSHVKTLLLNELSTLLSHSSNALNKKLSISISTLPVSSN